MRVSKLRVVRARNTRDGKQKAPRRKLFWLLLSLCFACALPWGGEAYAAISSHESLAVIDEEGVEPGVSAQVLMATDCGNVELKAHYQDFDLTQTSGIVTLTFDRLENLPTGTTSVSIDFGAGKTIVVQQDGSGAWTQFSPGFLSCEVKKSLTYTIKVTASSSCTKKETLYVPSIKVELGNRLACFDGETDLEASFTASVTKVKLIQRENNKKEPTNKNIPFSSGPVYQTRVSGGKYALYWSLSGHISFPYFFDVNYPEEVKIRKIGAIEENNCGTARLPVEITGGSPFNAAIPGTDAEYKVNLTPPPPQTISEYPTKEVRSGKVVYLVPIFPSTKQVTAKDQPGCASVSLPVNETVLEFWNSSHTLDPTQPRCPSNAKDLIANEDKGSLLANYSTVDPSKQITYTLRKGTAEIFKQTLRSGQDFAPAQPLDPGDYTLSIQSGVCLIEEPVTINSVQDFSVSLSVPSIVDNGKWCEAYYTNIKSTVTGGTSPYAYNWTIDDKANPNSNNPTVTEHLSPGELKLQLTDDNGCTFEESEELAALKPPLELELIGVKMDKCLQQGKKSTNIATVNVSGGEPGGGPVYMLYLAPDDYSGDPDSPPVGVDISPIGARPGSPVQVKIEGFAKGILKLYVKDGVGCLKSFDLQDLYAAKHPGETIPFPEPMPKFEFATQDSPCADHPEGRITVQNPPAGKSYNYVLLTSIKPDFLYGNGDPVKSKQAINADGVYSNLPGGTYYVRVDAGQDCESYSDPIVVSSPPPINVTLNNYGGTIDCPGGVSNAPLDFKVSGGSGEYESCLWEYTPDPPASPVPPIGAEIDPKSPSGSFPGEVRAGRYRLIISDSDKCTGSAAITLTGPSPYQLTAASNPAKCAWKELDATGQPVPSYGQLQVSAVTGGTDPNPQLTWAQDATQLVAGQQQTIHEGDPVSLSAPYQLASGTYRFKVLDNRGCESEIVQELKSDPDNEADFVLSGLPDTICYGDSLRALTVVQRGGARIQPNSTDFYEWELKDRTNLGMPKSIPIRRVGRDKWSTGDKGVHESFKLWVSVPTTAGCFTRKSFARKTTEPIDLQLDLSESEVGVLFAQKDSVVLGVLAGVPYDLTFRIPGFSGNPLYSFVQAPFYSQRSGSNSRIVLRLPDDFETNRAYERGSVVRKVGTRDFRFYKTGVTARKKKDGCPASLTIWVRVVDGLRIPNVFTPNGDGINDRWLDNGDPSTENIFSRLNALLPNMEVNIYTRTGQLVWTAKGNAIANGWDGKTSWGADLPVGTYYYTIKYNVPGDSKAWKPIAGSVTIVR